MRWYVLLGFGLMALLAPSPPVALAQNTCDGTIVLDYVNPPGRPLQVGDVLHVQGSFGSGAIVGGTFIAFSKVQFDLDCDLHFPLMPPCTDAGPVISYNGDSSISTTCGVAWTSNNPGGGVLPNEIEFTATPALAVPPNQANPPGFCDLNFDVTVVNKPAPAVGLSGGEILGYKIAFCNNGLTSGNFQTASGSFAVQADDFQCHETPRHSSSRPKQVVSIADPFGSDKAITVLRSKDLCAPVDKNGENPAAPSDPVHLVKYAISGIETAKFTKPKNVPVTTQFGTFVVDVGAPTQLMVPSSKSVMPAPPPAPLPADAENHFLCHTAILKSGPAFRRIPLSLIDQFAGPYAVKLAGLVRLCMPASKNNEPVVDPSRALLCFSTRTNLPQIQVSVTFVNQLHGFAPETNVPLTQYTDFCALAVLG